MKTEVRGSVNCLDEGARVDEYQLQSVVGEGGFGIVYRARDLSLDRIVAIKEYFPSTIASRGMSHDVVARTQHKSTFNAGLRSFINEARLLARFSHPSLVHVYRFFEANGTAYMVMHYYEGQTLRGFLEEHPSVGQTWLVSVLSPLFDALEMLHAADCYHRDIAPDNILLTASGVPVLLDFGAARRVIGDMTQALTMVLKPGYAPIEQYVDDGTMPQGAWTDIYQLGAVIYWAITGTTPSTAVARMVRDTLQLQTPQSHPAFNTRFLAGVYAALQVHAKDRPQTMAEFRQVLGLKPVAKSDAVAWSSAAASRNAIKPAASSTPSATTQKAGTTVAPRATAPASSSRPSPGAGSSSQKAAQPAKPGPQRERAQRARTGHPLVLVATVTMLIAALAWGARSMYQSRSLIVQQASSPKPPAALPSIALHTEIGAPSPPLTATSIIAASASASAPITTTRNVEDAKVMPSRTNRPQELPPFTPNILRPMEAASAFSPVTALSGKGKVSLIVRPWGRVVVDKRYLGISPPLNLIELPVGRHTVEISNPAGTTLSKTLQVEKDEPVTIRHEFESPP